MHVKFLTLGGFSVSEIDKIGLRSTGTSLNPEYYLIMCLVSGGFKGGGGAPPENCLNEVKSYSFWLRKCTNCESYQTFRTVMEFI